MDHTVPLLYVAEYHCDGMVKVSFIKLMRTPGSVKRIVELDENNIVTNERFTIEIDGTDYEIINVEDVSNIDTEDSFLEMIRKYSCFHGMMLYDVPFSDVKCELYHIDYSQNLNVGLDDDGIWDETETNEQIKADFYQKNEDGLEIGYYYEYEKPYILEDFNIMPATELRVEEYGIESKIRAGKVMVACVKDYLHG